KDGRVLALVTDDNSIAVLDRNGEVVDRIGVIGNGPGELLQPADFDIAPDGEICVADRGNDRVTCFTPTGAPGPTFGVLGVMSIRSLSAGQWAVVNVMSKEPVRVFQSRGTQTEVLGRIHGVKRATALQARYLSKPALSTGSADPWCLYSRLV